MILEKAVDNVPTTAASSSRNLPYIPLGSVIYTNCGSKWFALESVFEPNVPFRAVSDDFVSVERLKPSVIR